MPFKEDPGAREHPDYCSYCYRNGQHNADGSTLKHFQEMCYTNMVKNGLPRWKAKFFAWTIQFAPYWKGRK